MPKTNVTARAPSTYPEKLTSHVSTSAVYNVLEKQIAIIHTNVNRQTMKPLNAV
jgi:hypothetical protein